ncbi:DUF47 domain-containing protein [Bacillus sp. FJAT-52991]|uniref:DUF47 domain-containing protein n=1 Tax=Bacillus kandeliae TaxID=3129297 RepID=A0ABZ2NAT6_9BACI
MLHSIAVNLKESADFFSDFKLGHAGNLKNFAEEMKKLESKGDTYMHNVITELNQSFITPIEREDILALAISMDDVLDSLEETAAMLEMYSVVEPDEYMLKFVEAICGCAVEIEQSVDLLPTKKLLSIREHVIKIKDYETACDGILRQSIKHLFATEKDPIQLIKTKEIYENLEQVADYCQDVANTLETIIMKNA